MSVKTLDAIQVFNAAAPSPKRLTYSVAPLTSSLPRPEVAPQTPELEAFLGHENPIGCLRGVMWVMGFNMVAFLAGFGLWAAIRYF